MLIITIDGPAGAGKSTVAKRVAAGLSECSAKTFEYLDTGSMYRTVALLGIRGQVDWDNTAQLELLAKQASIEIVNGRTFLDREDVTDLVRSPEVTEKTRFAADNPVIRNQMTELQRLIATKYSEKGKGLVTEGRDQGTEVFPDAPLKIFLTATPAERARRRVGEIEQRHAQNTSSNKEENQTTYLQSSFEKILQKIEERDLRDSSRTVGPLREPHDSIRIATDGMSVEQVVEQIILKARECFGIHNNYSAQRKPVS